MSVEAWSVLLAAAVFAGAIVAGQLFSWLLYSERLLRVLQRFGAFFHAVAMLSEDQQRRASQGDSRKAGPRPARPRTSQPPDH